MLRLRLFIGDLLFRIGLLSSWSSSSGVSGGVSTELLLLRLSTGDLSSGDTELRRRDRSGVRPPINDGDLCPRRNSTRGDLSLSDSLLSLAVTLRFFPRRAFFLIAAALLATMDFLLGVLLPEAVLPLVPSLV